MMNSSNAQSLIRTVHGTVSKIYAINSRRAVFEIAPFQKETVKRRVIVERNRLPHDPCEGEIWFAQGLLKYHDVYRWQLEISEDDHICRRELPSGAVIVDFLTRNKRFPGITKKDAERLWQALGQNDELYDLLNNGDVEALVERGSLSPYKAELLVETWQSYAEEAPVVEWLHKHQFPVRVARKIIDFYGKDAVAKLNDDPYRMLAFEKSWSQIDKAARAMGIADNDRKRLVAAIEHALYERYDKGHTAVPKAELQRMVQDKLSMKIDLDTLYDAWKDRAVEWVNQGFFQSTGAFAIEEFIRNRVKAILSGSGRQQGLLQAKFSEERLREFEASEGYPLNKEQVAAVKMALEQPICLILGGAGVGKTTVLKAIYHQMGRHVALYQMALSGRAARRMEEATETEASTIVTFLHQANEAPLPDDAVLSIDEASMLDAPTFCRIMRALKENGRIVLIGDPYQLPPIGPGLVFHILAEIAAIPKTVLVEVQRQRAETGIPAVAQAIRDMRDFSDANDTKGLIKDFAAMTCPDPDKRFRVTREHSGVNFIPAASQDELVKSIVQIYRQCHNLNIKKREKGERADYTQILAARNETVDQINKALHDEYMKAMELHVEKNCEHILNELPADYEEQIRRQKRRLLTFCDIAAGEPLLHHSQNDYARKLYNGSLGKMLEIYEEPRVCLNDNGDQITYVAKAEFDGNGIVELTAEDFEYIKLGYAITVHKAQGSQFDRVIVASEKVPIIVDNAWFYTAITRSIQQVVLVGNRLFFNHRVKQPPTAFNRCVGLRQW